MNVILKKYALSDLTIDENKLWKQIDDEMLENELKYLMNGMINENPAQLQSKPTFDTKYCKEVESEFIAMITLLNK